MKKDELEARIAQLPTGYISKKVIRGKECYYRQWKENGKVKSEYIKKDDVDYFVRLIDERRQLQDELRLEIYRNDHSAAGQRRLSAYIRQFYLGRNVPIGVQDYEALIANKQFYIDKTSFIGDWWKRQDQVSLITRPRRFGKTLNLSMVNCFFSLTYANRSDLFEDFEVWQDTSIRPLQGTFPVIFLSFGSIKHGNAHGQLATLKLLLKELFSSYEPVLSNLSERDRKIYDSYFEEITDEMALQGVQALSALLYKATGRKVIILLDEYDTPMLEAWVSGNWDECANHMRIFFNATFKSNPYLERALLTGITQISKESFFSDLNHLKVFSLSSKEYEDAFGFTEEEVFAAMDAQHLTNKEEVKAWFNGFTIGSRSDIYNPWSIVNFLREKELKPYWVNSGSNKLIDDFFRRGSVTLKNALEDLMNDVPLFTRMHEETSFQDIDTDETALWSLLVANGYLKIVGSKGNAWDKDNVYELKITNHEVLYMFQRFVREWFTNSTPAYNGFITALLVHDIDYMNEYMNRITQEVFSYFDTSGNNEPERFYHGFVLGMMVDLKDRYVITSNRESGLGRYDVVLKPNHPQRDPTIIMEFKVFRPRKEADLTETATAALQQIKQKNYDAQLIADGIVPNNIYRYGLAFHGKEVLILSSEVE